WRPWQEWPDLLSRLFQVRSGLTLVSREGTSVLLALHESGNSSWLVWFEDEGKRGWTRDAIAGAVPAAMTLARVLSNRPALHGPTWVDRSRRQQRLEDAASTVARLVHDFNNILTGILGFTELSLAQIPKEAPPHELLKEAYEAALSGSRLLG